MLEKLDQFSFNHSDQIDRLYEVMTTADMKASFDSRGEELKTKLNEAIDKVNFNTTNKADKVELNKTIDQVNSNTVNKADKVELNNHKASADHDVRYYTKDELTPYLRGGDTSIKEEVFVIVNSNNGDGTFTYSYNGNNVIGMLTEEGGQVFTLTKGYYTLGLNRVEVIINDTLRRSVASGGVLEISPTSIALTSPEGNGAEITIKYYERIGMSAEYNVKIGTEKPPFNSGKNLWFKVIG